MVSRVQAGTKAMWDPPAERPTYSTLYLFRSNLVCSRKTVTMISFRPLIVSTYLANIHWGTSGPFVPSTLVLSWGYVLYNTRSIWGAPTSFLYYVILLDTYYPKGRLYVAGMYLLWWPHFLFVPTCCCCAPNPGVLCFDLALAYVRIGRYKYTNISWKCWNGGALKALTLAEGSRAHRNINDQLDRCPYCFAE